MNNQARQILQDCIRDYGRTVGHEPQRLEALLKDYAKGQFKREVFLIVQAAKENVVDQLLDNTAPLELISVTLSHQLTENYGIDRQLADWTIETWLFALNLSRSTNKVVPAKQKTPTVEAKPQPAIKPIALIDGRYLDNGDGTVTDQTTGFQWMRCSIGQSWDGKTCLGIAKEYNWGQANKVAKKFSFAGYVDWRLPTIDELKSILETNKTTAINHKAFPTSSDSFVWSSSQYKNYNYSEYAWGVYFYLGYVSHINKTYGNHVRLVRGG
jgi:hypothetical protein